MNTRELIEEAASLPVEERAKMAEFLLQSLNPPEKRIDRAWAGEAARRLDAYRSGSVEAVPGEKVLQDIIRRFGQ